MTILEGMAVTTGGVIGFGGAGGATGKRSIALESVPFSGVTNGCRARALSRAPTRRQIIAVHITPKARIVIQGMILRISVIRTVRGYR